MTRQERVVNAIEFKNPDRAPVWALGPSIGLSDILTYDLSLPDPNNPKLSEWSFPRLRRRAGGWTVPEQPTLEKWKEVDAFHIPRLDFTRRFGRMEEARRVCGDRYRLARFGLSGFSVYTALRGHTLATEDYLRDPDRFTELMLRIMDFESSMFEFVKRVGFDGVEFTDNWRLTPQSNMTLSLWRVMMRPLYQRQIELARRYNLHVWFTLSMEDAEFFPDLIELGANVLRVEHPGQVEPAQFGRNLYGRVCLATRLDELYDPKDLKGSADDIRASYDCFRTPNGGFIATIGASATPETLRGIYEIAQTLTGGMNLD